MARRIIKNSDYDDYDDLDYLDEYEAPVYRKNLPTYIIMVPYTAYAEYRIFASSKKDALDQAKASRHAPPMHDSKLHFSKAVVKKI